MPDVRWWARERIDSIGEFLDAIKSQHRDRHDRIHKRYREHLDLETFWDETMMIDEAIRLAGMLSIVALYRVVEHGSKQLLSWAYDRAAHLGLRPTADVTKMNWDDLKKSFARDFQIPLPTVEGYLGVNELRCLNNAIKHQNKVSAQLAKFNWKRGDDLDSKDFAPHFRRLEEHVVKFLVALGRELQSTTKSRPKIASPLQGRGPVSFG